MAELIVVLKKADACADPEAARSAVLAVRKEQRARRRTRDHPFGREHEQ